MHSFLTVLLALILMTVMQATADSTCIEPNLIKCNNPCEGANRVNDSFVCGDPRLGPKQLPSMMSLGDITHPYRRFGTLCPSEFLSKWTLNGSYVYPPQNGFQLNTAGEPIQGNITLAVGTLVDRFGSEYGTFMSPAEAAYTQRALPPSNLDTNPSSPDYPFNYHVYTVSQEFVVLAGPIAPWFEQPGQGVQFYTFSNIMTLIADGFLTRIQAADADLYM